MMVRALIFLLSLDWLSPANSRIMSASRGPVGVSICDTAQWFLLANARITS